MTHKTPGNIPASVHQRLLTLSRERHADFNNLLTRYALERFLYRLSRSRFASRFVLKGALLFEIWSNEQFRTTKDADLLLMGEATLSELEALFRSVASAKISDDGLIFLSETVRADQIREEQAYQGARVILAAVLGKARIHLQLDIGFGDVVVPSPETSELPSLLGHPPAVLFNYTKDSSVSEKFEAIVALGLANSRMKDLYDIWVLSQRFNFEGSRLARAIEATFARRGTSIPRSSPIAFTPAYAHDAQKQAQWRAYLNKAQLGIQPPASLEALMGAISSFLQPPMIAVATRDSFGKRWPAGGPWA